MIASGLAIGLLFGEMVLALLSPRSNERTTAGLNVFEPDPELGYRLQPNVFRKFRWIDREITIETDVDGRRTPEGGRSGESGPRLIVAGDSFVFGNEVQAEETFTELLGARSGLTPVNLGVGGYSLEQSAGALARHISQDADSLDRSILVLYVGNDIEWGAATRLPRVDLNGYLVPASDSLPSFLLQARVWVSLNSRMAFLAQRAYRALRHRGPAFTVEATSDPVRLDVSGAPRDRWIYDEARFTDDRLAGHGRVLETLARVAEQASVPVTLVLLPERGQVNGELGDLPNRKLLALAEEIGLEAVDLLPQMRARRAQRDTRLWHDVAFGHLSKEGHRIVAEILAESLLDSSVER